MLALWSVEATSAGAQWGQPACGLRVSVMLRLWIRPVWEAVRTTTRSCKAPACCQSQEACYSSSSSSSASPAFTKLLLPWGKEMFAASTPVCLGKR